MARNNAGLNASGNGFATAFPFLSIHTTGTATTNTGESTAARKAANWTVAANGNVTATNIAFTGGAASGPAIRVGYWSAATGGTFGGGALIVGDQTFNAAGEFTITSVSETVTSS